MEDSDEEDFPREPTGGGVQSQKPKVRWTNPRYLLRSVLMLDDTPHSIALGTAIGTFLGMTPTFGIQMISLGLLIWATRGVMKFNRVAAFTFLYLTNPLTVVPIYWFEYQVGRLFVEGELTEAQLEQISEIGDPAGWWRAVKEVLISVGQPLLLGSLIVSSLLAILSYPVMRWLIFQIRSVQDGE